MAKITANVMTTPPSAPSGFRLVKLQTAGQIAAKPVGFCLTSPTKIGSSAAVVRNTAMVLSLPLGFGQGA
jgi:hypothetical protein